MSLAILGIGTAVPPATIDQHDAERIAQAICCQTEEHRTWLPTMYGHTGIATRHLAFDSQLVRDLLEGTRESQSAFLPDQSTQVRGPSTGERMLHYVDRAGPLALEAAHKALEGAGLRAKDVTHLVLVSCTGFRAPGVDLELIVGLGLPPTVERTLLGFMGCHGALNGLRVARAFTAADPTARVLLCAVELCALHYHYGWDPQRMVANAIFADGAAALIGAPASAAPVGAWQVAATGSCIFPDSAEAMSWIVGDHGFEMTLSKRVPGLIAQQLRPWLNTWLAARGLSMGAVRSWAVHPGGPRILSSVGEALELPAEALAPSRAVFAEFGNMSSPTVLFILEELRRQHAPRPCVALGFGPGLAAEATLLT